jgi:hypothetical protein
MKNSILNALKAITAGDVVDLKPKLEKYNNRYPRSKNKLSNEDIDRLDELFQALNKATRYSDEFNDIADEIEGILGIAVASLHRTDLKVLANIIE